jgi:hypothetical protein
MIVSPFSFPFRLAGRELAWTIYKVNDMESGRLIPLTVTRVPSARKCYKLIAIENQLRYSTAAGIIYFEELFIQPLALHTTKHLLRSRLDTMLAYSTHASEDRSQSSYFLDLIA